MTQILATWIGATDLAAASGDGNAGQGPILQAVVDRQPDALYILADYPKPKVDPYVHWIAEKAGTRVGIVPATLRSPMSFGEIYEAASGLCERVLGEHGPDSELTFHISPGTPAMAAVWIILAKTKFKATIIQSSPKHGVEVASVPFDISADYLPDLLEAVDRRLKDASGIEAPGIPGFDDIIHRSPEMRHLMGKARRVAIRSVPVLIEGESGTGKELLARSIHKTSRRWQRAFVPVNCGAIPPDLIESELFGHTKGAFTGADQDKTGLFQSAHGGTLFLDEIGELPLLAQVKLLRVLQDGEVRPVGSTKSTPIDVRVVSATNRSLLREVGAGRFREDLFYRLAVAVLTIPPLRERRGDVGLLIDHLMGSISEEFKDDPGFRNPALTAAARNRLLQHTWPGNVRELTNTLRRLFLWADGEMISDVAVAEALLERQEVIVSRIIDRPLGDGFTIHAPIAEVAKHYLERAITEAQGNYTKAAELVGLSNRETLKNWMAKYKVPRPPHPMR
jgi:DNA-binding NtrC family response regulator